MADRVLTWEGCSNVRDLGGLITRDGRKTRWGALVRADHPARLTAGGWSALLAHGIRTEIALRSKGVSEDLPDIAPRPAELTTVPVEVEDLTDEEFLQRWVATDLWCTPLYYRDALERWPERHAAAIAAVTHAPVGGVLFHCVRGVDRTGIIAILLLALVGAAPDDIIADYEMSIDPERDEFLAREHTTVRDVLLELLAWLDVERYLLAGGLSQADLSAARARLLEPVGG